jgi:hypothetical protein
MKSDTLMKSALRLSIYVSEYKGQWTGETWFYFDGDRRSLAYRQRKGLKTKEGAIARQRRETKQFLLDLRAQIDEVLAQIDTAPLEDAYNVIRVLSSAYETPKTGDSE